LKTADEIELEKSRESIASGDFAPLARRLEDFLRNRTMRLTRDFSESVLQAIIESFSLDNQGCMSELCLVVAPANLKGEGHFGFVDLFFPPLPSIEPSTSVCIPVVELKNVAIVDLWRGTAGLSVAEPSTEMLLSLQEQLNTAQEPELLQKKLKYKDKGQWHMKSIQDLLTEAMQQVGKYLDTMKNGKYAGSTPGIRDRRVVCEKGNDRLDGYVMLCIGGTKIIWFPAKKVSTKYSFRAN
jgi:hypothetical protein